MLITYIIGIIGILLFLTGYALGKIDRLEKLINKKEYGQIVKKEVDLLDSQYDNSNSYKFNRKNNEMKSIEIDESKFVTKIKTEDYKKDFDELGEKTISDDNLSQSISKLSKLKKKK